MSVRQIANAVLMMALALFIANCGQGLQSDSDTGLVAMKMSNEQETTLLNGEQVPYDEQEPPAEEGDRPADEGEGDDGANNENDEGTVSANDEPSGEEQDDSSSDDEGTEVGDNDEDSEQEPTPEGDKNFICILEGPGKSVRLGFINDKFAEHGKTPGVVCMSEKACNEQVSRVFNVKGPHKRGFCPDRNPHVLTMTYDQIKAMIDDEINQEEE